MKDQMTKILGASYRVIEENVKGKTVLKLSGKGWSFGPLLNEKAWLKYLDSKRKSVTLDVSACSDLGVYTLQWIYKVNASDQGKLRVVGASKTTKKLIQAMGLKNKQFALV